MSCWIQCNDIKATGGNPLDDPSFNSDCSVEKIEMVDGVVASTGSCFDSWIFGYADPPELAGFYHNDTSTSAAKCQLLCQSDDRCVRFQFTTTSLGMSTAGVPSYRCVLKNADQVVSILEGDPGGQGFNSDICDTQSTNGCSTVGDCLKCGGESRCAWRSNLHVSGWRHCRDVRDTCDPQHSCTEYDRHHDRTRHNYYDQGDDYYDEAGDRYYQV